MKRIYVRTIRGARVLLHRSGLIKPLDRWAGRSRTGLWVRSWFAVYDLDDMVRVGVPWWTFAAIDVVEDFMRDHSDVRVLEWGSGVSTLWLAERAATVESIEHDSGWADELRPRLSGNVTLKVVPATTLHGADGTVPSEKRGFEGLDFAQYVAAGMGASEVDLVVVDGRARGPCLEVALQRLAPDGLLVFDNVDRRRYREAIAGQGNRIVVHWTQGRTPSLPYPTRTALVRWRTE